MRISIKRSIKVSKIIYLKNLTTELKKFNREIQQWTTSSRRKGKITKTSQWKSSDKEKGKEMKKVKIA